MLVGGTVFLFYAMSLIHFACIAHVLITQRDRFWLAVLIIPVAGAVAYLALEGLPNRKSDRGLRALLRIDSSDLPGDQDTVFSPDEKDRFDLADEYYRMRRYPEAVELYKTFLSETPELSAETACKLAEARLARGDHRGAISLIGELSNQSNTDSLPPRLSLLMAQHLEQHAMPAEAEKYYRMACEVCDDLEYKYRYAKFLYDSERSEEGNKIYQNMTEQVNRLPSLKRRSSSQWIDLLQQDLDRNPIP